MSSLRLLKEYKDAVKLLEKKKDNNKNEMQKKKPMSNDDHRGNHSSRVLWKPFGKEEDEKEVDPNEIGGNSSSSSVKSINAESFRVEAVARNLSSVMENVARMEKDEKGAMSCLNGWYNHCNQQYEEKWVNLLLLVTGVVVVVVVVVFIINKL